MAASKSARASTYVRAHICGNSFCQCTTLCGVRELDSASGIHSHRLFICWSPQLVRTALFPNAPAREVWPFAKLFSACIRRHLRADPGLYFTAGVVLRESVVRRKLDNRDRLVEHSALVMDSRARADAWQANFATRLVVGFSGGVRAVRN